MTTRTTRQHTALAGMLEQTTQFCSAQQLHSMLLRHGEKVSLTTVYRHLNALAEVGEVDALSTQGGETRYRRCERAGNHHHHHLVCRDCGHTVEVAETAVDNWATRTARQHGFTEVDHAIELSGRCAGCRHSGHR